MTYITLANKWRPKNINEIIGQDQAIFIIKNIINNKKIHPSYIINGPYGTGKTSIAKILTKCLNCKLGITILPCDICECCISIEKNKNVDYIEIDAASNNKIEEIKEIIELAKYKNILNRYKIFTIDECHMLSHTSFNYLLKILEENTQNTIYILITTQIEKIPKTIISRCIDIKLNKIKKIDIKLQIEKILKSEMITYDDLSLEYVATFSNNSLRHAINILEKTLNFNKKYINISTTRYILGIIPELSILFIIKSIYEHDIINIIKHIKNIIKTNLNYKNILMQIYLNLYKILLYKNKIIYDYELIQYKIFIYLSKILNEQNIYQTCLFILERILNKSLINEIDLELILISVSIKIKAELK